MNYIGYNFSVDPVQPGSEILIAFLSDLGFESFVQTDLGFTAYIPANLDPAQEINNLQFDDFSFSFTVSRIEERNWNEEWEKSFEPVLIGDQLCIRAGFHLPSSARMEVVITPKMSFGTGHHQTTRLVCAKMLGLNLKGKKVLDMGCGTGVLAILAEKLGASEILGIDNDEWSVTNATENCEMNDCSKTEIQLGTKPPTDEEFDLILANINRNVLKSQMPGYAHCLRSGGTLLLSGFFTTDVDELLELAKGLGFKQSDLTSEEGWAMLALTTR